MSREAFELVARVSYPELSLTRDRDGEYIAAQTQGWWMGWQLAMGEMLRPVVPAGMDYSDATRAGPSARCGPATGPVPRRAAGGAAGRGRAASAAAPVLRTVPPPK